MAVRKKIKILFGRNMKYTGFGRKGGAKGMYSGGFEFYVYGIKGIFGITSYTAWGSFTHNNPHLN